MRIYVSGRIKDYPAYLEHFKQGCDHVRKLGHEPVNPCELTKEELSYEEYMKLDLKHLIECEGILMLDGWEKSAGARVEHLVAVFCGLEVYYQTWKVLTESSISPLSVSIDATGTSIQSADTN
jgi:hypothetical protein